MSTAHDWATSRAIDILGYAHRLPFNAALDVIANMLRIAHSEGFKEGVESAREVFNRAVEEAVEHARRNIADTQQHGNQSDRSD